MLNLPRRCLLTVSLALSAAGGFAQLPSRAQIEADLAGPFATSAAQPLLNERGELARRLEPLMAKQAEYLAGTLRPWTETSGALSLTDSKSGEHGIRPNAHTAFALAVMVRTMGDDFPAGLSRETCRDKAVAILRFVLPTHGAGGRKCSDGKQWKDQWQSALWADRAGKAAWLLWDDLDPEMRWLAARMAADEADRFVGKTPPAQVEKDTKAEENAWNSTVVSLAANMLPRDPRAADWRRTAAIWAMSSFVRKADLAENPAVDGIRLADALAGPVIHDDYTLENHDRIHPDYMNTINLLRYQKHLYDWGGAPPPQALTWNTRKVYNVLGKLVLPDGGYVYANGQDWELHRLPHWIDTHAGESVWFGDARAARRMRLVLDTAERMSARDPEGGMFLPGEYFFPSNQHMALDIFADTYLLLRGAGEGAEPVSEERLWKELSGRHVFETGKVAMVRTPKSVSTFSWGQQIMGMVLPLSKDLLLNPNERSMIGMIGIEGAKGDSPRMVRAAVAPMKEGFGVAGILERAGGAAEQRFAFLALPDGRTVYADAVRTTAPAERLRLDLGTLGVLNEARWVYHDGSRSVFHEGGEEVFTATGDDEPKPVAMNSKWVNLDDMLGVVCLGPTRRQVYHPNRKPARGRVEQLFHLNTVDLKDGRGSNAGKDGDPVARTLLVFYPSQKHEATRDAAEKTKLDPAGPVAGRVILEDGTTVSYDLSTLEISYETP